MIRREYLVYDVAVLVSGLSAGWWLLWRCFPGMMARCWVKVVARG